MFDLNPPTHCFIPHSLCEEVVYCERAHCRIVTERTEGHRVLWTRGDEWIFKIENTPPGTGVFLVIYVDTLLSETTVIGHLLENIIVLLWHKSYFLEYINFLGWFLCLEFNDCTYRGCKRRLHTVSKRNLEEESKCELDRQGWQHSADDCVQGGAHGDRAGSAGCRHLREHPRPGRCLLVF